MNEDMRTAEKFMQTVNAMKRTLDTTALEKDIDLEIAGRHNLRRKLRMIRSMQQLYAHLHGNAPMPRLLPSETFDPFEGADKTNIHYMFKSMTAVPPWELRRDLLVEPTAVTLRMLEVAAKLFPAPQVFALTLLMEEFINRWTLPKRRREWSDEDAAHEFASYRADMDKLEERMKKAYADLSIYFGGIESPEKNPVEKKITETHKRTKALAEKFCAKEENASFVAQEWAHDRWVEFRNSPEAKARYCTKDHRLNHADCFDYFKRQAMARGFRTAAQFDKAIDAAQKRKRRKS